MSICIAIAVPDGIALAADSQITGFQTITQAIEKDSKRLVELENPIQLPISWSRKARKLFSLLIKGRKYAFCIAGAALLNQKTIYSIFKHLEKTYTGNGSFDTIVRHFVEGIKTELRKQTGTGDLSQSKVVLSVEFIISGYEDDDISKPCMESWMVLSGSPTIEGGGILTSGEVCKWTNRNNGLHTFGGCWIGRTEFISHIVTHNNAQMPPIQGQYELFSLEDAVDYTRFLVNFTCDYQRFAAMIPDCGKPIISAKLTTEDYTES